MRRALALVAAGAVAAIAAACVAQPQAPKQWDDAWARCDATTECVAVQGPCGGWNAVNQNYLEDAKGYYAYQAMLVRCRKPENVKPAVMCAAQRCVTADAQGKAHE